MEQNNKREIEEIKITMQEYNEEVLLIIIKLI